MNDRKLMFLVCWVLTLFVSNTGLSQANAATYYISTTGADTNNGTSTGTPWQSLSKVNAANLVAGDVVLFKRGDIFRGTLVISKSGAASNPITFGAYGSGAQPVITGFSTVSSWTNLGNNIWESTNAVSTLSAVKILAVNGVNTPMGRWPNTGYRTVTSHVANTSITDSTLTGTPNWTGAEVVIRKLHWILDRNIITAHSGGTLTYTPTSSYAGKDGYGYFIQNDPKTLDQQNEWYYNASTKKLRIYSTSTPSNVQVPAIDTLVTLSYQNYIIFDNLAFQGANTYGFNILASKNITIQNSTIDFTGMSAIWGGTYSGAAAIASANFIVQNNQINHTNSEAIHLMGEFNGAIIRSNTILNTAMIAGLGNMGGDPGHMAIYAYRTDGLLVEKNTIDGVGFMGITFNANNTIIRNNLVRHFCTIRDDCAGIYSADPSNTWNAVNQKVLNNIVLDSVGASAGTDGISTSARGIYADNYASNIEIAGNTTANIIGGGIYVHNGDTLNIHDNTSFNNGGSQIDMSSDNASFPIRNIRMNNNILFANSQTAFTTKFGSISNDFANFGTFDNNYHVRPTGNNVSIGTWVYYQPYITAHNLAQWKSKFGQESHSTELSAIVSPYKVNSLVGSSKYSNGSFPSNISGISCGGNCVSSWNNNKLDGGALQVMFDSRIPTGNSYLYVPIGAVAAGKDYILKFSLLGSKTNSNNLRIYIVGNPWRELTPINYKKVNTSRNENEILFSSPETDANAKVAFEISMEDSTNNSLWFDNISFSEANISVVNPDEYVRFEYNASDNPKTVTLNGNYIDAKNSPYSGSITIAPWTSLVLIKTDKPGSTDTTAPTVAITSPTGGTVSGVITISATASDNVGVTKVEFYKDSDATPFATDTTSPYSASLDTKTLSNNTHTLKIKAFDPAGNTKISSEVTVVVSNAVPDTTAPTVEITSPTGGTVSDTITILATATDNIGVTKVDFYHDDTFIATDTTTPYSIALSTVSFSNGNYVLTAVASDAAGNTRGSTPVTITINNVSVDTSVPTVAITSPTGGTVSGTITFTATATDNVGVTKVEFYKDSDASPFATDSTAAYTTSFDTNTLTNGAHSFKAMAFDAAGNSKTSAVVTVTVSNVVSDTIPPTVAITSPSGGMVSGEIMISASAGDNIGVSKVDFYVGNTLISTDTTSPYSASWTTSSVSNGSQILKAIATDSSGNETTSTSITVTVSNANSATWTFCANENETCSYSGNKEVRYGANNVFVSKVLTGPVACDNATFGDPLVGTVKACYYLTTSSEPTVAMTSPTGGTTVSGTITLAATASDSDGITKVEFYKDNDIAPFANDSASPYSISLDTKTLSNGSHSFKATAFDPAGNTKTSLVITLTVNNIISDTTAPTVAITTPTGGTVSGTITIAATAIDNIGVSKVEFFHGNTLMATDTTSPYSMALSTVSFANGTYILTAVASDAAGNTQRSTPVSVIFNNSGTDTIAPTVTLTSPTGTRTLWGTTRLAATASDNVEVSKVEFYQGSTLLGTDTTSSYSLLWNTRSVSNGTYVLKAIAYDAAGNIKTSQTVSVSVRNFRWRR